MDHGLWTKDRGRVSGGGDPSPPDPLQRLAGGGGTAAGGHQLDLVLLAGFLDRGRGTGRIAVPEVDDGADVRRFGFATGGSQHRIGRLVRGRPARAHRSW